MADTLTMQVSDAVVTVAPSNGGAIGGFWIGGDAVLQPPATTPDVALFAMVPWANRVGDATFSWDGRRIDLEPSDPEEPHALHGHGWRSPWTVGRHETDRVELHLTVREDVYPFPYTATQTFHLEADRLTCELEVTNLGPSTMPLGVGFHPWFPRPGRVSATVDGRWVREVDGGLPSHWEEAAPFRSVDIDSIVVDESYTGWDRRAIIDSGIGRISVASDLDHLHLFTPRGRNTFALEPVSSAPDAFNHPERGLLHLEPGATHESWMRISVEPT